MYQYSWLERNTRREEYAKNINFTFIAFVLSLRHSKIWTGFFFLLGFRLKRDFKERLRYYGPTESLFSCSRIFLSIWFWIRMKSIERMLNDGIWTEKEKKKQKRTWLSSLFHVFGFFFLFSFELVAGSIEDFKEQRYMLPLEFKLKKKERTQDFFNFFFSF